MTDERDEGNLGVVRDGYVAAATAARQGRARFEPVRPVVSNPTAREADVPSAGRTSINAEFTRAVAELFTSAWDVTLQTLTCLVPGLGHGRSGDAMGAARTARRLLNSVIRPLGEALAHLPARAEPGAAPCVGGAGADAEAGNGSDARTVAVVPAAGAPFADLGAGSAATMLADDGEWAWRLALTATRWRVRLPAGGPVELVEATAALQDLACGVLPAEPPATAQASQRWPAR